MNWISLTGDEQIENIKILSNSAPQVIFKHSTRCSISAMIKSRLEKSPDCGGISFYLLDLISYRNLSSKIEVEFQVHHESPQVLLIINGACVYDESHIGINMKEIISEAGQFRA